MSFLPEDRGAELRALFFESAGDLLQALNEAGLDLEDAPADEEVIRRVRRAVHTLKSTSATFGAMQLAEASKALEQAARTGKLPTAEELAGLEAQFEGVRKELVARLR